MFAAGDSHSSEKYLILLFIRHELQKHFPAHVREYQVIVPDATR
jgi:hypothetical protein